MGLPLPGSGWLTMACSNCGEERPVLRRVLIQLAVRVLERAGCRDARQLPPIDDIVTGAEREIELRWRKRPDAEPGEQEAAPLGHQQKERDSPNEHEDGPGPMPPPQRRIAGMNPDA